MRKWLIESSCKREGYLRLFDERMLDRPKNCCTICGFDLKHYQKDVINNTEKERHWGFKGWEKELRMIFHVDEIKC